MGGFHIEIEHLNTHTADCFIVFLCSNMESYDRTSLVVGGWCLA